MDLERPSKIGYALIFPARRVVSGERALKSKERFDQLITTLEDALGTTIGASRGPAVDSGFADNSLQVDQIGKNVAPQLYLCTGILGFVQYLVGMKASKVIAAINKALIFNEVMGGLVNLVKLTQSVNSLLNANRQ